MASYYRQLESSLLSYAVNETSANYTSQSDSNNTNHAIHLFILTSVWVVLLITIICGTIGNILVLYVYISRKDNKTSTFFIKMLAIVDLIVCLILAPLELYYITTGKTLNYDVCIEIHQYIFNCHCQSFFQNQFHPVIMTIPIKKKAN